MYTLRWECHSLSKLKLKDGSIPFVAHAYATELCRHTSEYLEDAISEFCATVVLVDFEKERLLQ